MKKSRKKGEIDKKKKKEFVIALIFILVLVAIFLISKFAITGKSVNNIPSEVKIYPLSASERAKVVNAIESSEFIKDMPKTGIVSLRFFNFNNTEKIWQDGFLIGKNKILTQGKPDIYLSLHSKYISELNDNNLCELIRTANNNGDLGFYSERNEAILLIKYAGMLKYRKCFGF